jgi:hypothetical protein
MSEARPFILETVKTDMVLESHECCFLSNGYSSSIDDAPPPSIVVVAFFLSFPALAFDQKKKLLGARPIVLQLQEKLGVVHTRFAGSYAAWHWCGF